MIYCPNSALASLMRNRRQQLTSMVYGRSRVCALEKSITSVTVTDSNTDTLHASVPASRPRIILHIDVHTYVRYTCESVAEARVQVIQLLMLAAGAVCAEERAAVL